MKETEKIAANGKRKGKVSIGTLLVIAAVLFIPVLFAVRSAANSTLATGPSSSAFSSSTSAVRPPECTFPLAEITTQTSFPETYTFSDPKVVLNSGGNLYSLVEWLPDSRRVLMTEDLYDTREQENDKMLRQSIELYDPQTGEFTTYATRYHIDEPPAWQAGPNAVVYPAMNFLGRDKNTNELEFTRQIWVSHGSPDAVDKLDDNLPQFPLAVKPDGSEMAYLSNKQVSKRNAMLQAIPSARFDPNNWDYSKLRNGIPVSFQMAWQPGTSLIFLYSDGGQLGGGYTFVLDSDTGNICELNLGGWALRAVWSPNGQYLAIERTEGELPIHSSDIAVLDSVTGNVSRIEVTPAELRGRHYVDDLAWAPDGAHILAIGTVFLDAPLDAGVRYESGLYLVDLAAERSVRVLPGHEFYANSAQKNLSWSPDGSKLLVLCPTTEDERVCAIDVERQRR